MHTRKVILYIAMSLDGYIAEENGGLDWLSAVEEPGEDYGYSEFNETVDTIIMGRKTYDKVLSFGIEYPHKDKQSYILTRSKRDAQDNIVFYNDNLKTLVGQLKKQQGKNIYVDGGAEIVNELMKDNLIDEYIISIIPVLLGSGISLFKNGRPQLDLKLISSKSFKKGLVQLHYKRLK